ncbi:hypothetical protein HK097_007601, partial [Rhizophlyctis rosea]
MKQVRIVEKKDTKKLYALKYINKMQCIRMRAIQNIFRERAILEEIEHPFLVNLRFAFQDDQNMFMVTDLMMGGDLRYHLSRLGGFPEEAVRVFAMELVTAVHYMHRKSIVHRDIKPDNVLLDNEGHVHLTDFNIAVHCDNRILTSHSGTLSYMAPEVFAGHGYTWTVDWWSLGVTLYESLYGRRPFRSGGSSETAIMNIMNAEVTFPGFNLLTHKPLALTPACINFVSGLLERNLHKRLGCGPRGIVDIMEHPWFDEVDWAAVERMELTPAFVPDPDKANFDATYDLEELLLDDNPLTYRPRKRKKPKAGKEKERDKDKDHDKDAPPPARDNGLARSAPLSFSPNPTPHGKQKGSKDGKPKSNSQDGGEKAHKDQQGQSAPPSGHGLTPRERIELELDYIDANFKPYDSSMNERYRHLAGSLPGGGKGEGGQGKKEDVPRWARNLDLSRETKHAEKAGEGGKVKWKFGGKDKSDNKLNWAETVKSGVGVWYNVKTPKDLSEGGGGDENERERRKEYGQHGVYTGNSPTRATPPPLPPIQKQPAPTGQPPISLMTSLTRRRASSPSNPPPSRTPTAITAEDADFIRGPTVAQYQQ